MTTPQPIAFSDVEYTRLSLALRDLALSLGCPPELVVPGFILFSRIGIGWHVYAGSWCYTGMLAHHVDDRVEAIEKALAEVRASQEAEQLPRGDA